MKIRYLLSVLLLALVGCSHSNKTYDDYRPLAASRIMYGPVWGDSSLFLESHAIVDDAVFLQVEQPAQASTPFVGESDVVNSPLHDQPLLIQFGNESVILGSDGALNIKEYLDELSNTPFHYFVVSHSHGKSFLGNASIAQGRADAVYTYLINSGVDDSSIELYSSWSSRQSKWAINRGVYLIVVDASMDRDFVLPIIRNVRY